MSAIQRVQVQWTGFQGAPGYSVLHNFTSGDPQGGNLFHDAVDAMFRAMSPVITSDVVLQVEDEWQILESSTGVLEGVEATTNPKTDINAGGIGAYSTPVGAVINWGTDTIRNGRRLRGRTFVVPLVGSAFGSDGQLTTDAQSTLQGAVTGFIGTFGIEPIVFGRPGPLGNDGVFGPITSGRVPRLAAILRSRRD